VKLPDDFTTTIPPAVLAWVLKAGVSSSVAAHYGFGWSEKLSRIVIPVWKGEELVAVQSRAVYQGQRPKYMNSTGGAYSSPVFRSDDSLLLDGTPIEGRVITEDILSCIRTGRIIPSIATLGTRMGDRVAVSLLREAQSPVYVWYDGDPAGVKGALKIKRTLDLVGLPCTIIKTTQDPKAYSNTEIRQILKDYL